MKKVALYVAVAILLGVVTVLFPLALYPPTPPSVEEPRRLVEVTFPSSLLYASLIVVFSLVFALGVFYIFKRRFV